MTARSHGPEAVIAEFAARLRDLRERAGNPSYRAMAVAAGLSHTSLSQAARGRVFPSARTTAAFARACGASAAAWAALHREYLRRLGPVVRAPAERPSPDGIRSLPALALAMRVLKMDSGLSLSEISLRSRHHTAGTRYAGGVLPRQTIADLTGGTRLAHADVLAVFLLSVGMSPEEVAPWLAAHRRVRRDRDRPPRRLRPAPPPVPRRPGRPQRLSTCLLVLIAAVLSLMAPVFEHL